MASNCQSFSFRKEAVPEAPKASTLNAEPEDNSVVYHAVLGAY